MTGTIELHTPRLLLRQHTAGDAEILHRVFGLDEAMYRYSGWNPYATAQLSEQTVQEFIGSYTQANFYGWAIEQDGLLVGIVGAYDFDPCTKSIEAGLSIRRDRWGEGLGTEALSAVLEYLTGAEGIQCVHAWCAAANTGSRRVMEKAGMVLTGTETGGLEVGGKVYDKLNFEYRAERILP